ncbi:MAG: 3-deoxy-D-manno-octulosonic acid transferase [Methylocystaceae bacterium]|nr:3-deoxy-D-manno-octulosonic acid transferase [Methylocystaceae bacterium]
MIYSLYRLSTTLAAPLIHRYLQKRLVKGKEHPTRFEERFGHASQPRPTGQLIWLHGASVGEAISLLALIDKLQNELPDYHILMTTGTVTSAELMEKRLPEGVIHQFVPVDRLPYVRRFLDYWRPDIALWAESELWPNLLHESHKRGIKMALINARMSSRSLKKWLRFKGFIKGLLSTFDLCLAQTDKDCENYRLLGVKHIECVGNLKYAAGDLPCDEAELAFLKEQTAQRPLWLAASTHPGEELRMGRVHHELKKKFPGLLTLIAPRHPERGDSILMDLKGEGLCVAQRSKADQLHPETDVYLCDTMGELGLFYRLSPIVFMGKSLDPLGGQNPLEPARLDCALLCGPYMTNFTEIMNSFEQSQAITIVKDETELSQVIDGFLRDPVKLHASAVSAKQIAYGEASVLDRVFKRLCHNFSLEIKGD